MELDPEVRWLLARDGALTAMQPGERWWAGCSVPRAAARFMLKTMEVRGTVGCFLNPLHAAQVRVALDLLAPRQAVVAIVPEEQTLAIILHGEDFAGDIRAGRLWLAAGPQWESQLRGIFQNTPGLPTPVEFIRPITSDTDATHCLIDPAQRIFAEVGSARAMKLDELCQRWEPRVAVDRQICLLAPSEFRLWDDAGLVLAKLERCADGPRFCRLDSDCPTSSSPLALGIAAGDCDAVLAANVFRSHLPGVVSEKMPWITWVTTPRIPSVAEAGPCDRLMLADPCWLDLARRMGWTDSQIELAGWPALPLSSAPQAQLALVADTGSLEVPKQLEEYSSQVLLWEFIRDELMRDPFLAVEHVDQYLKSRRARFQIGDDGFDRTTFVDRLIIPAVQQGVARRLVRDEMPLRLFGRGWDQIEGLAQFSCGPVTSREEFEAIVSESVALIHAWPWQAGHAVQWTGRPVVRCLRTHDFLRDARAALTGDSLLPAPPAVTMSSSLIRRVHAQFAREA